MSEGLNKGSFSLVSPEARARLERLFPSPFVLAPELLAGLKTLFSLQAAFEAPPYQALAASLVKAGRELEQTLHTEEED